MQNMKYMGNIFFRCHSFATAKSPSSRLISPMSSKPPSGRLCSTWRWTLSWRLNSVNLPLPAPHKLMLVTKRLVEGLYVVSLISSGYMPVPYYSWVVEVYKNNFNQYFEEKKNSLFSALLSLCQFPCWRHSSEFSSVLYVSWKRNSVESMLLLLPNAVLWPSPHVRWRTLPSRRGPGGKDF